MARHAFSKVHTVNDPAPMSGPGSRSNASVYKKEYWAHENLKFSVPHYRLIKSARLIEAITRGGHYTLLDLGCGPATLMRLLPSTIEYHGIDIAIQDPGPQLIEADFLEAPITFADKEFDIIVAQGVFEYMGGMQDQKFGEIAHLMTDHGVFVTSYTNFGHRQPNIYASFSNVQSIAAFKEGLERHFRVRRMFPASHNWSHGQPIRRWNKTVNMHINRNIPGVSPRLAVEYFFVCSNLV